MSNTVNYSIRPYKTGDENYVAEAHERIYREEYGWGENFSNYAKQIAYDYANTPKQKHAEMWIAEVSGKPVGSIMLQETDEAGVGQLRLYLLEPDYRNHGIGTALINTAMKQAHEWNFHHLFLGTAEPCTDARRKYAKLGFVITDREPAEDWALDGSVVYEERWDLELP